MLLGAAAVRGPPGRERDWVSLEAVKDLAETQKAGFQNQGQFFCRKTVGRQVHFQMHLRDADLHLCVE